MLVIELKPGGGGREIRIDLGNLIPKKQSDLFIPD